ncbi:SAF domain-containing protein [bacterium]|nr:SAF domain-containing protein [bacterium]
MQLKNLFMKEKIITIVFLIIAFIGGILIFIFIKDLGEGDKFQGDFNEVLIAKQRIEPGSQIQMEDIEKQKISKSIFSDSFIEEFEKIKDKTVIETIEAGEIITYEKFKDMNKDSKKTFTFSSYIPVGKKAVTIPVSYFGDLSMLNTGDKVDIISSYYCQEDDSLKTETIISGEEIILFCDNEANISSENSYPDNEMNSGQFPVLDFTAKNLGSDYSEKLIITFYLNSKETESLFASLERGVLYMSICSSKV